MSNNMRKHKYNAKRTIVDGITFPSKREAKRYGELKLLLQAGEIADLELQPEFPLHDLTGSFIGKYVGDFKYFDFKSGKTVVEDSKGFRTPLYKWKKKHAESEHRMTITEV